MPETIADRIQEFYAPVQPDDCKRANQDRLAAALKVSGPVVHRGHVVSVLADGTIHGEARPFARILATEHEPERDPTDAELAAEWKLPLASETPPEPTPPPTT